MGSKVLILVLVEDTRGALLYGEISYSLSVLILVLVEDTRGAHETVEQESSRSSLNPCFSGRYSGRFMLANGVLKEVVSLNPCFSGRYSGSPLIMCKI